MDNGNSKISNDEIVKRIVQEVALVENVSVDDIYEDVKSIDVSQARAMCMYIAKELTDCDCETIGDVFNKHHTTVIYNIEKINSEIKENIELKNKIKSIIENIYKNPTDKSLNGIYETFSELVGFENTKKLYEVFRGKQIAFPESLFANQIKNSTK